jgi:hypothetical protein
VFFFGSGCERVKRGTVFSGHAVKACKGNGGMMPLILLQQDRGEWSVSLLGRFAPVERTPGTLWIGGWVGPRFRLQVFGEEKKYLLFVPGFQPRIGSSSPTTTTLFRLLLAWRSVRFYPYHSAYYIHFMRSTWLWTELFLRYRMRIEPFSFSVKRSFYALRIIYVSRSLMYCGQ